MTTPARKKTLSLKLEVAPKLLYIEVISRCNNCLNGDLYDTNYPEDYIRPEFRFLVHDKRVPRKRIIDDNEIESVLDSCYSCQGHKNNKPYLADFLTSMMPAEMPDNLLPISDEYSSDL